MTPAAIPNPQLPEPVSERKINARRSLTAAVIVVCAGTVFASWFYFHRGAGRVPADAGPLSDVVADMPPGVQFRAFGFRRLLNRPPNVRNVIQAAARRIVASIPDGVSVNGNGYLVRAGDTHLEILPAGNSGRWQYRFSYVNEPITTPAQLGIYQAMTRARDPAVASKAGVTTDQLEKLKKVPAGGMIVDAADREKCAQLFATWLNAAGRRALTPSSRPTTASPATTFPAVAKPVESALVSALANIGQKQLSPSKQNAAARAEQIRTILGDAEIAKLK